MSEDAPAPAPTPPPPSERAVRWQALFQQSADAVFVLDRRRRLLFVNRAFEALTGTAADEVRGLICRPRPLGPAAAAEDVLARALAPPREVLQGRPGHARRLLPSRTAAPPACWDVEFFPLRMAGKPGAADEAAGLVVLGRVTPVPRPAGEGPAPLPEKLVALRERAVRRPGLPASKVPAVRRLAEQVRLASAVRAPVLLVGEAGTGKETLARLIHYQGPQRERAFAALDCERLPPEALAGVLFGERGAAQRSALGAVYLRQPAALPRDLQARLLEWLAEDGAEGAAPPRILAGSRSRLEEEVRSGRALEGLAWALGTLVLEVPPLRQRRDDLPALVEQMLERAAGHGTARLAGLTPAAWEVVRGHPWPGNLRELYAVLSAASGHARGEWLDAADLPAPLRLAQRVGQASARPAERPVPLAQVLEQVERRLIELALRRAGGNKTRAAELLSMWRPRLLRRMAALKMDGGEGGEGDAPPAAPGL
jgi:transcriptional regulator with PAS, ATPase and Fis domain